MRGCSCHPSERFYPCPGNGAFSECERANQRRRLFHVFVTGPLVVLLYALVALIGAIPALYSVAWGGEQHGIASTYGHNNGSGDGSNQRLACGGRLDVRAHTAAHPNLPCGTWVRVTNTRNGRMTVVRVNDRGPFIRGRVIDLSPAAARSIGIHYSVAPVKLRW